jgi:hypothetical protein
MRRKSADRSSLSNSIGRSRARLNILNVAITFHDRDSPLRGRCGFIPSLRANNLFNPRAVVQARGDPHLQREAQLQNPNLILGDGSELRHQGEAIMLNSRFSKKSLAKYALAIGLGVAAMAGTSVPSLAQGGANGGNFYFTPTNNGTVWSYYRGYNDGRAQTRARSAFAQATGPRRIVRQNSGAGLHYYGADDNGTVWSFYPGYTPLR